MLSLRIVKPLLIATLKLQAVDSLKIDGSHQLLCSLFSVLIDLIDFEYCVAFLVIALLSYYSRLLISLVVEYYQEVAMPALDHQ